MIIYVLFILCDIIILPCHRYDNMTIFYLISWWCPGSVWFIYELKVEYKTSNNKNNYNTNKKQTLGYFVISMNDGMAGEHIYITNKRWLGRYDVEDEEEKYKIISQHVMWFIWKLSFSNEPNYIYCIKKFFIHKNCFCTPYFKEFWENECFLCMRTMAGWIEKNGIIKGSLERNIIIITYIEILGFFFE